jgi:hypothetical protein
MPQTSARSWFWGGVSRNTASNTKLASHLDEANADHRPLDNIFSEAIGPGHEDRAGFGVEREDHATCCEIGADHLHDRNRQRDLEMIEAIIDTIGYRTIRKQGGEAVSARIHEIVQPDIPETIECNQEYPVGSVRRF